MRLRPFKTCAILLAAAMITVAVAWWIHLHDDVLGVTPIVRQPTHEETNWWRRHKPAGFPDAPGGYVEWRVPTRQAILIMERPYIGDSAPKGHFADLGRCGWPCFSMEATIWNTPGMQTQTMEGVGWIPKLRYFPRAGDWIPLRPCWPGFLLDTALFASILWVVSLAAPMARRRWRIRRGRCPTCAYPIGAGSVCTECGVALTAKSAAQ